MMDFPLFFNDGEIECVVVKKKKGGLSINVRTTQYVKSIIVTADDIKVFNRKG